MFEKEAKEYIRFGEIPKDEKSKKGNGHIGDGYEVVGYENGVSVWDCVYNFNTDLYQLVAPHSTGFTIGDFSQSAFPDNCCGCDPNKKIYVVTGIEVGYGADNEPLLKDVKIVKELPFDYFKQKIMFEKEAEGYADKYVTEGVDELKRKVIKGHWQDGAEFGYNKANERHTPDEHIDKDKVVLGIIKHCNKTRYSLVQWNGEWWYQYGTYNAEVRLIAWYDIPEQGFQKGAEFGYNKANEWHYVKDGIYPTHSNRVLVFTDEGVGFGIYGLDDKKWHTYDTGFDVIAWKEIVLPELKESE